MSVGKLLRLGLPFSNVVATGVATAQITPGRTMHRGLRVYGASQRPAAIDKRLFGNASVIRTGRLNYAADVKTMADSSTCKAMRSASFPRSRGSSAT